MTNLNDFPKLGVSACIWRGSQVLIIQRAKPPVVGIWSLPGGRVEAGETLRQAALRELKEETGVGAELLHLVDVVDVIRHNDEGDLVLHFAVVCFAGKWTNGDPRAASDALSAKWANVADLEKLEFTPGTREAISKAGRLMAV